MAKPTSFEYQVFDRKLVCPVCENNKFYTRETLMNTAGMAFFNLEFINKTANNYICDKCGYVYWFMDVSEK